MSCSLISNGITIIVTYITLIVTCVTIIVTYIPLIVTCVTIIVTLTEVIMQPDSANQYFSKTLEKGLSILSLFNRDHTRFSLSEIARICGFNKTSTYRLVNTLVELGYLKKHSGSKALKIGEKALFLSYSFLQGFELLQSIKPLIDEIFSNLKITIDSALLFDLTLVTLYHRQAPSTVFFRHNVLNHDLHARSMGKAVLSRLPPEELDGILEKMHLSARMPNTVTDTKRLKTELEQARSKGYAVNNEEYFPELVSIAAPLINFRKERVLGAVSFDFAVREQPLCVIEEKYSSVLIKLANDMSEMMTITEN